MKNFVEYLTESKKTYDFKIGVAGEYADNCVEDIKSALEKYGLVKLTDGKRTPINKTLKQWLQARFVTPLEIEDPLGEKTKQIISRIQHVFHDTRMNEKKMKRKRQVLESYNFVDTKPSISEDSFNMFDDK